VSERPEDVLAAKVQETLDRIPGYRGYRLKEERRDADRRVREAVADAFAAELARVERIGRDLANARRLGEIGAVEQANQAIRHFIDRVRAATPGYGGLFGDREVDGVALDQLRLFDDGLLLGVDDLTPGVDRLEAAAASGEPLGPAAADVTRTMETLLTRLDTRQEVINTGHAASRDSVLAALRPIAEVVPPPVFSAQPGDAISILGDDHLVDARIDVEGRPRSFRIFRIGRDPEEWLYVDREPGGPMARLSPIEPPARGAVISGHGLEPWLAGTGDGELTGERGSSGLRPVRYALLKGADDADLLGVMLDWEGERQAFVGRAVEPLDVEVFRRAEAAG
jgi:hypothetical protein